METTSVRTCHTGSAANQMIYNSVHFLYGFDITVSTCKSSCLPVTVLIRIPQTLKRRAVKISVSINDAEVQFVVHFFYLRGFNFPQL
jgi:hypothetical protein